MKRLMSFLGSLSLLSHLPRRHRSERIWDNELKRYLTDQEMMMAEVFMTEEEAVKTLFPKSEQVRKEVVPAEP